MQLKSNPQRGAIVGYRFRFGQNERSIHRGKAVMNNTEVVPNKHIFVGTRTASVPVQVLQEICMAFKRQSTIVAAGGLLVAGSLWYTFR